MKIYTRTGDSGETGLFGGARVRKDDDRVEAYGCLDELNTLLGVATAYALPATLVEPIERIQAQLFVLGAEVACRPGHEEKLKMKLVNQEDVEWLEALIDDNEAELPALTSFILPGGTAAGAQLHVARTATRRAERRCLCLELRPEVEIYLNRLSDALFVLARRANHLANVKETPWVGRNL